MSKATGNDVRAMRKRLGWTLQELADHWGLHRMTVVKWEAFRDECTPRPLMVACLLRDLERTIGTPSNTATQESNHETTHDVS